MNIRDVAAFLLAGALSAGPGTGWSAPKVTAIRDRGCESGSAPAGDEPGATARLHIGADGRQRRFFNPELAFRFPLGPVDLATAMAFEHVTNGRLEGRVDFWIRGGVGRKIGSGLRLEALLNHMCRHVTSREYPTALDLNEALGRLGWEKDGLAAGVGAGGYLGKNKAYRSLLTADFRADRILGSEFTLTAGVKVVNGRRIQHDLELAAALAAGVDLFVRSVRPYDLHTVTYLGMRFGSGGAGPSPLDAFGLGLGFYPVYDGYKAVGNVGARLKFFEQGSGRLLATLAASIPILRSGSFFGRFRPDEIIYPLSLEYERRAGRGLLAVGYFRYRVDMPVDVDEVFDGRLSVGLGLRNQSAFERLEKPVRYEVSAGRELDRGWEGLARAGVNTIGRRVDMGIQAEAALRPRRNEGRIEGFLEFGRQARVRPYIALEIKEYGYADVSAEARFQTGVALNAWF
jgi:hypothetical protein